MNAFPNLFKLLKAFKQSLKGLMTFKMIFCVHPVPAFVKLKPNVTWILTTFKNK